MIKWPWKASDTVEISNMPWAQALAIPLLANLSDDEQLKLVQLADRFLQQKRLVFLQGLTCLLYTSPSPRDPKTSRMPSSA